MPVPSIINRERKGFVATRKVVKTACVRLCVIRFKTLYLLFSGYYCEDTKKLFIMEAITKNFEVSTIGKNMFALDMKRNNITEDEQANDRSSMVNTEINTLNKGDFFRFDEAFQSDVCRKQEMRTRNQNGEPNFARFIYVNQCGNPRRFYLSGVTRVAQEVMQPTMEHMVAQPTGTSYAANRKGFAIDGEPTKFAQVAQLFVSDKALAEAFTKHQVELEVVDKKAVRVARFNDNTRTANQNLMYIEFAEKDETKLGKLIEELKKEAEV